MGSVTGLIAAGLMLAAAYNPWGSPESHQLADKAAGYFNHRDFERAHEWYQKGYDFANTNGLKGDACRFLLGLGGVEIGRYRVRDALKYLLEARRVALELNDVEQLGGIATNLS